MNRQRRKRIEKAGRLLEELIEEITAIKEEEEEAYDNLPEGLQESERGVAMYNAAEALDDAVTVLEEATELLMEAME